MSNTKSPAESLAESLEGELGYKFKEPGLLIQALSHRSVGTPNNERLEYLGDSILGFFIAESLYQRFPHLPEGDLTKMRAFLVRQNTLAMIARSLKLQEHMIMGGGELKSGGYNRDSILSDAFEAMIGAVYLDGGMDPVKAILTGLYVDLLNTIKPYGVKDSKTLLQEVLQKRNLALPVYELVNQAGEAHNLTFTVTCTISGVDSLFTASGDSRKKAEQIAAALALDALK
jgi:ribonuclease-3